MFRWPFETLGFSPGFGPWAGTIGEGGEGTSILRIETVDFGGHVVSAQGPVRVLPAAGSGKPFTGPLVPSGLSFTPFAVVITCAPVPGATGDSVLVKDPDGNDLVLPAAIRPTGIQVAMPIRRELAGGITSAGRPLTGRLTYVPTEGGEIADDRGATVRFPGGSLLFPILGIWQQCPDMTGTKALPARSAGWRLLPDNLVTDKPAELQITSVLPRAERRLGLYRRPGKGYAHEGGEPRNGGLIVKTRVPRPLVILEDTVPPRIRYVGSRVIKHIGRCWVYTVSDVGEGVDDDAWRILVDGRKARFDTDPDKDELYIQRPPGKTRHVIAVSLSDGAGNVTDLEEER